MAALPDSLGRLKPPDECHTGRIVDCRGRSQLQTRFERNSAAEASGSRNTDGRPDYLREVGRAALERVFFAETPLWQILDREKSRNQWQDFREGRAPRTIFPFTLTAFIY
jgi:hypothetical protein